MEVGREARAKEDYRLKRETISEEVVLSTAVRAREKTAEPHEQREVIKASRSTKFLLKLVVGPYCFKIPILPY